MITKWWGHEDQFWQHLLESSLPVDDYRGSGTSVPVTNTEKIYSQKEPGIV